MDGYQYPDAQFHALGDATRRAVLARLADEGPMRVGELARQFPISRPAISQHLRVLKDARLVIDRVEGARRLYTVNPAAIESLNTYLVGFWTRTLSAFNKRITEDTNTKEDQ